MARKAIRSEKLRKTRRRIFVLKIASIVIIALSIFIVFVLGLNTKSFQIQDVVVTGGHDFVNQDISDYSQKIISKKYFGLVPKRNILLYPRWEMHRGILRDFPRIKDITFELDPFKEQTLNIYISEREEYANWCREDQCYFLDRKGYVFDKAPTFFEKQKFVYAGGIDGNPVGMFYLDGDKFRKLDSLMKAIIADPNLSFLEVTKLEYLGDGEYKILTTNNGHILFTDSYGIEKVYQNLVLAIKELDISAESFEYIDIRLPDKVFYK